MEKLKKILFKIKGIKFKDIFYTALVVFLAIIIALTSALPVSAALEKCTLKVVQSSNYLYMSNWAYPSERNGIHLATVASGTYKGEPAYCIEFGKDMGNSGISENIKDIEDISAWNELSAVQKLGIKDATIYGYPNFSYGVDEEAAQVATQLIVWEYSKGYRTAADGDNPTAGLNGTSSAIEYAINTAGFDVRQMYYISAVKTYSDIRTAYVGILNGIKNHHVKPSFDEDTIELEWNSSNSRYEATLTDSNKVLSLYSFQSNDSSVKTSVSGNKLTIYTSSPLDSSVKITLDKTSASCGGDIGFVPDDDYYQSLVGRLTDPVTGYIKVKTATGNIKIQKDSEDGIIKGISFTVKGCGETYTVETNSKGVAALNDIPSGSYTVKESTDTRYVSQNTQSVTVTSGGTASVSFSNELKKGNIKIMKDSEDSIVKGFTFSISGSDGSSLSVTTNSSGIAEADNLPVYDSGNEKITYTVKETDIPVRYIDTDSKTLTIKTDSTSEVTFNNILKKFNITLTKRDIEETAPQGDATLAGAVYGIYKNGELLDSYTTDADGSFTTEYYVCGDGYTIKEISPSEGYLLDETSYKVNASASNFTLEYNTVPVDVTESVIKGNIAIIKHSDDGSTGIETPEKGASFQIYLKSAGSFAAAKDDEKDTIVCDSDGFCSSSLLPYGIYTVHQTAGWDGTEYITDFDVYINSDGMTYKFLINNSKFSSYLKIVKSDAETGKTIPIEGAGFEIYDSDGHRISMQYTYPEVTTIHTFYTNSEGYLITPQMLEDGEYTLVEVAAPYGYVLNSAPQSFTISQANSSTDTGVMVVMVKIADSPQKGTINVSKTGEVLSGVEEDGEGYSFKYENSALSGAVFSIYAAEDIFTPDGTVRYTNGELVDEITTGEDGTAKSTELYLGQYKVCEKRAPETFASSSEEFYVTLTYAGEDTEATSSDLSVYNERQKAAVSLRKTMQKDEIFDIGNSDEILSVKFGLYAAEDISAPDGSTLPIDGLIAAGAADENGLITFDCDLPINHSFYVKEVSTDEKYVLSEEKYQFKTAYASQDTKVINIDAADGGEIENKLIYGSIICRKTERETKEDVEGAVFGLFSYDETEFTEETAYLTSSTDKDGIASFDNVPYGGWIIYELTPAEGFLDNNEIYHVTLNSDGAEININVVNDKIPELKTTAEIDMEKEVCATEIFVLTDTVEYQHLIPGSEYTIDGILMDKSTSSPLYINGGEVTTSVTFIPEEASGAVELYFTFDSKFIKEDKNIVAFESISKDGIELACHADIDDENQTVSVLAPKIKTEASADGEKEIDAKEVFTLTDTVEYENLTPGKKYVLKGVLMDKKSGDALLINKKEITSKVTFTPEKKTGSIDVTFEFDSGYIAENTDIVVYETLYRKNTVIAEHKNIDDTNQTVRINVPSISTEATVNGEKEVYAAGACTISDNVLYQNLSAGREYTLKGILMNKESGKPLLINNDEVSAEMTFTPKKGIGEIDMEFSFDASLLDENTEIVVFEYLYREDREIAEETNIENKNQTVKVYVPLISTLATINGKKAANAGDEDTVIVDKVEYANLQAGAEYTVAGILMDKDTQEEFVINEENVASNITFTPQESDGSINVTFAFDSSSMSDSHDIVVYETLYKNSTEIAEHKDINDENQTVSLVVPSVTHTISSTPKTGDESHYNMLFTIAGAALFGIIVLTYFMLRHKHKNKGGKK